VAAGLGVFLCPWHCHGQQTAWILQGAVVGGADGLAWRLASPAVPPARRGLGSLWPWPWQAASGWPAPPHPACDSARRPFTEAATAWGDVLQADSSATNCACAVTSPLVAPRLAMRRYALPGRSPDYVGVHRHRWASVDSGPLAGPSGADRAEAVVERGRSFYRQRFDLEIVPLPGLRANSFAILIP